PTLPGGAIRGTGARRVVPDNCTLKNASWGANRNVGLGRGTTASVAKPGIKPALRAPGITRPPEAPMRYLALATDYDGTLAHDGRVDAPTLAALDRVRASGRRLFLVTGRELPEL